MKGYHPVRESAYKSVEMGINVKSSDKKSRPSVCKTKRRQAETHLFASQQEQLFPLHDFTISSGTAQGFFSKRPAKRRGERH